MNEKWMRLSKGFRISIVYSGMIILTMVILNVLTGGYPWCMYPIFGVLWWPMSAYFAGRRQPLHYALCAMALLSAMFVLTYLFTNAGGYPWFLFPVLAVGWWPLSVWGAHAGAQRFSVTATLYILLTLLIINLLSTPHYFWCLFPAVLVIWWPLTLWLHARSHDGNKEE